VVFPPQVYRHSKESLPSGKITLSMVKHLEQTLAKWEEKIITFMKKRFLSKLKINNFCKIEKSEWKWLSLQIFKQV